MSGRHARKGKHVAENKYPKHPANRDYTLAHGAVATAIILLFLTGVGLSAVIIKGAPAVELIASAVLS
jgi:hypothetical protein